ncbi:Hydroxymethylglutaryl-CoA lyase YngG [compost metagenome]
MTASGQGKRIYINEVVPRDGFQIEPRMIPTEDKVALINQLSLTGLAKIEATSFVSPKAIPNLADADDVVGRIVRRPGVPIAALVPNVRGAQRALEADVDELNLVMSVSETHNLANLRMTREQSFEQIRQVVELASGSQVALTLSLSCTFGCPMEGVLPVDEALHWAHRALDIGITGVTLCDTTGMAWPTQVQTYCTRLVEVFPEALLTAHFHNTRGMALSNVLAAIDSGIAHFDGSLGGLGGCPYAPGASGNVCTEDMVHMLELMGYDTGVELKRLLAASRLLSVLVGHETPGQVVKAGHSLDTHPTPDYVGKVRQR